MKEEGNVVPVMFRNRLLPWLPAVVMFAAITVFWRGDFFYAKTAMLFAGLLALLLTGNKNIACNIVDRNTLGSAAVVLSVMLGSILLFGRGSRSVEQLIWWGGVFATILLVAGNTKYMTVGVAAGMALVSGFGLLQWIGLLPSNYDAYGQLDPASLFGLSNFSAEFLAPLIPLLWMAGRQTDSPGTRKAVQGAVALSVLYIIIAGSRAGWLGLGVGLAALLFSGSVRKKLLAGLMALLAVGILLGAVLKPGATDRFRLEAQKTVLQMVMEHPLGVGSGWFADYADSYLPDEARLRQERTLHRMMDPHNEFLRVLAEMGWPGAILLLLAVGFWLRELRRDRYESGDPGLWAAALAFIAICLVSTPGRTASGMLVLGTILGWQKQVDTEADIPGVLWRIPAALVLVLLLTFTTRFSRAEQAFRIGLAYINFNKGPRYNQARNRFVTALQYDSGHRSARLGYVKSLFGLHQWELAFRAALPLLQNGNPPDALLRLVVFAGVRSGDPEDIVNLLNQYQQRIFGWKMMDILALGQELLQAGLPQAAAELLDQPRIKSQNEGLLMLALARLNAEQPQKVVLLLEGEPRRNTILEVTITLALAYEQLGQYDLSEQALRDIDNKIPGQAKAALYLARNLWQQGKKEAAVEQIGQALRRDSSLTLDPTVETDEVFRQLYNYVIRKRVRGLGKKPTP